MAARKHETKIKRRPGPLLRFGWRCLVFAGRTFPLALIISAAICGAGALWLRALSDTRFHMGGQTLGLAGSARECPEATRDLDELAARFAGRGLFDHQLLSEIRSAYSASPWIKSILRLRRVFPNRVEVEFILRLPVAQVKKNGQYWLVDNNAMLLPAPGSKQPAVGLPEIVASVSDSFRDQPAVGAVWGDQGVQGALKLMQAIWASPLAEALPVRRVVVHNGTFLDALKRQHPKLPRFDLEVGDSALVRWGTFNDGDYSGELTSGEKLWMLSELLGRKEALKPGICLDVRTRLPGYALAATDATTNNPNAVPGSAR